jgi:hypothetical protein
MLNNNKDLRQNAIDAIAAYVHHEFSNALPNYPSTMPSLIKDEASEFVEYIDKKISLITTNPLTKILGGLHDK